MVAFVASSLISCALVAIKFKLAHWSLPALRVLSPIKRERLAPTVGDKVHMSVICCLFPASHYMLCASFLSKREWGEISLLCALSLLRRSCLLGVALARSKAPLCISSLLSLMTLPRRPTCSGVVTVARTAASYPALLVRCFSRTCQ